MPRSKRSITFSILLLLSSWVLAACPALPPASLPQPTLEEPPAVVEEEAEDVLRVAFVYVGPVGDYGWSYAHDQGRLYVEQHVANVETTYVEAVSEADAERVFRDLAARGFKVIFGTSFGYMDAMVEVSRDFPDTVFMHATGYQVTSNLGIYDGRGYQPWYLAGMVAGAMTETNILGYIAPFPIPEVVRNLNAFALGAQAMNPDVTLHVVWINTWFGPPIEREAAQALIDQGADVIARESDSTAPDILAEEEGVYAIGYNTDSQSIAPNAVLTAPVWNWGPYYASVVESVRDGTWTNEPYWGYMADGIIELAPINPVVPDDVVAAVREKEAELLNMTWDVFTGPIYDNEGNLRVPEGESMSDEELLGFDWLVAGVIGTVPLD